MKHSKVVGQEGLIESAHVLEPKTFDDDQHDLTSSRSLAANEAGEVSKTVSHAEQEAATIPKVEPATIEILLQHAQKHVEQIHLGQFEEFKAPFTSQVRHDVRLLYPLLTELFDHADIFQAEAKKRYIALQVWMLVSFTTFAASLFVAFSVLSDSSFVFVFDRAADFLVMVFGSQRGALSGLVLLALSSCVFTSLIRRDRLGQFDRRAGDFGTWFSSSLNVIRNKMLAAVDLIYNDRSTEPGAGERARKWAYIAQWLSELQRRLDSYATMTSWRVQVMLKYGGFAARAVRWFIYVGIVLLFLQQPDLLNSRNAWILFVAGSIVLFLVWDMGILRKSSSSRFQENFLDVIQNRSAEEVEQSDVFVKISNVVGNIRDQVLMASKK